MEKFAKDVVKRKKTDWILTPSTLILIMYRLQDQGDQGHRAFDLSF